MKMKDTMRTKKISKLRQKELEKGIFRLLEVPHFYFPMMQKGMRFTVTNTCFINLNKEEIMRYEKFRLNYNPIISFNSTFLKDLSSLIWNVIKRDGLDKAYPNSWIVPMDFREYIINGVKEIELIVDVLNPVKK
jgi:hypothetical protein